MKGSKRTLEDLCKRAKGVEKNLSNQSIYEIKLLEKLKEREIIARPQATIGTYNIDILAGNTIAVEIYGGGWHGSKNHTIRNNYILNKGFDRLDIWVGSKKLFRTWEQE